MKPIYTNGKGEPVWDAENPEGIEHYCHRCKGPNVIWSAASPLWNEVMRGGDINNGEEFEGIICPTCFCILAGEREVADQFNLFSLNPLVPLKTVTPSGRVWSEEKWLWVENVSEDSL